MSRGMAMNRPQRITRLASLRAPMVLLENEIKLAVHEYMDDDLKLGRPTAFSWTNACWALLVLLSAVTKERDELKRSVRKLQREAKAVDVERKKTNTP